MLKRVAMPATKDRAYWIKRLVKPDNRAINTGVHAMKASVLIEFFGMPRPHLTDQCMAVTNETLKKHIVTEQVHDNWKMTGLRPFVRLMKKILDRVKEKEPTLYELIGTEGCLCARLVRGSDDTPSNHAWGGAEDFKIGGITDSMGDGYCLRGLLRIYEIAKQVCAELGLPPIWWGAEFSREDSMHFEMSLELFAIFKKAGEFA